MALPFSPYIENNGFIFTSGQVHLVADGKLLEGTIEEKTTQVMKNLETVLEKAGVGFGDVVKATVYITDIDDYGKVSETYASFFPESFPARDCLCKSITTWSER